MKKIEWICSLLTTIVLMLAIVSCGGGGGGGGSSTVSTNDTTTTKQAVFESTNSANGYFNVNGGQYRTVTLNGTDESGTIVLSNSANGSADISGTYSAENNGRATFVTERTFVCTFSVTMIGYSYTMIMQTANVTTTTTVSTTIIIITETYTMTDGTVIITEYDGKDNNSENTATSSENENTGTSTVETDPLNADFKKVLYSTPFYMCDHEVTQAEYEQYCCYESSAKSPSDAYGLGGNYPAYYVSWFDAVVYCNLRSLAEGLTPFYKDRDGSTNPADWSGVVSSEGKYYWASNNGLPYVNTSANGYRLPTQDEWEFAARTGGYAYSSNYVLNDVAWYSENSGNKTHAVKGKNANSLGIHDMLGNVKEWCFSGNYNDSASGLLLPNANSNRNLLCGILIGGDYETVTPSAGGALMPGGGTRGRSSGFRIVRNAQ